MRALRIVCLGAALLVFASCTVGAPSDHRVVAHFEDVGDLVEKGQVQVNDVEVGRISDIRLVYENGRMTARVEMVLDEGARVPAEGLEAIVRQTSLLGEQFIQLVPVSTGPPYVGDVDVTIPTERTERRVDVETVLSDLSAFVGQGGLEDLNRFTHAQALILEDRGRRFGEVLEELEMFTGVLAHRRSDIGAAIDSLASASGTLVRNKRTLDRFLDSFDDANALLADQGDRVRQLFASLRRFGSVSARFLARHEGAIDRQFRSLRPVLAGLAGAQRELRVDIAQLATFLELFPQSLGGGPNGREAGDYVQVEAVLCEALGACNTRGEKGDVPGEGS